VLWGVQRFSKGLKLTRIIRRVHTGTIGRLTRVSGVLQSFPKSWNLIKDKWNNTGFIQGLYRNSRKTYWNVRSFPEFFRSIENLLRMSGTIQGLYRNSRKTYWSVRSFPEFFWSLEILLRMSGTIQGLYRNSRKTYWSVSLSTCLLLHMTQQLLM
jgi:hypothetical protein